MESPHIKIELITDFIVGKVSDTEHKEVSAHLAICPTCAISKMKLEKTIGLMQTNMLEDVPAHIFERTLDLFNRPKTVEKSTSFVNEIIAVIKSATSDFVPVFGLRSGQPELVKRLTFLAKEDEINLQITQNQENWNIIGELLSKTIGNTALLQNNEAEFISPISDLGEFSFSEVKKGKYRLVLSLENSEILFPEIEV